MFFFKVHRKTKGDCCVMIVKDRATDKYCFVNLTHPHVCACRFNTVTEALQDMNKRDDVISYEAVESHKIDIIYNEEDNV